MHRTLSTCRQYILRSNTVGVSLQLDNFSKTLHTFSYGGLLSVQHKCAGQTLSSTRLPEKQFLSPSLHTSAPQSSEESKARARERMLKIFDPPVYIPEEERPPREEELDTIKCIRREPGNVKKKACRAMRRTGRTPGMVFDQSGDTKIRVHMDSAEVAKQVKEFGRLSFTAQLYNLEIYNRPAKEAHLEDARVSAWVKEQFPTADVPTTEDFDPKQSKADDIPFATYRVLAKQIHVCAVTDEIENVNFMICPKNARNVKVDVPVKVIGKDDSIGLRRGGWLNVIRWTVRCMCKGDAIPEKFEVDVSNMDIGDSVRLEDLVLPEGAVFHLKDYTMPVVKISGKAVKAR
mmetsp:Transcript_9942/g.11528  ORF Transcript_9942/g.11528 Transcript_9942/m.11528 type:complete len:347 (+) Transcript_9942:122-1162(+)|eukprot:CAMPEP_0197863244 /NCGR_PEP_ID=MMETSP1438-20131217/40555_1 /TAXON_ID=1461541 /ORGANISM="Pterosperma sp., Strain CCMP1384" /LENGTH=346 /DNA_ID=CAMNT_0043481065 /DNA_START=121 /DNA_END=1161 /DNA_ORIENTATION=+